MFILSLVIKNSLVTLETLLKLPFNIIRFIRNAPFWHLFGSPWTSTENRNDGQRTSVHATFFRGADCNRTPRGRMLPSATAPSRGLRHAKAIIFIPTSYDPPGVSAHAYRLRKDSLNLFPIFICPKRLVAYLRLSWQPTIQRSRIFETVVGLVDVLGRNRGYCIGFVYYFF